jgi:uncharacterized protein YjbI with pentapeptide repeats
VNNALFEGTCFGLGADFSSGNFSQLANFRRINFLNKFDINSAKFWGPADFSEANFAKNAYFEHANFFNETRFTNLTYDSIDFTSAIFNNTLYFDSSHYSEKFYLTETKMARAQCIEANCPFAPSLAECLGQRIEISYDQYIKYPQKIDFSNAIFYRYCDFSSARLIDADFSNSEFHDKVEFLYANFSGNITEFDNTKFSGYSDFSNSIFRSYVFSSS